MQFFCLVFSDHCASFLFELVVVVEIAAERRGGAKIAAAAAHIYIIYISADFEPGTGLKKRARRLRLPADFQTQRVLWLWSLNY